MSIVVFFLVLGAAFLHAGWNFLSKKNVPSWGFYAVSNAVATLLLLPAYVALGGSIPTDGEGFRPILAGSVCMEMLYFAGLIYAYRRGDLSFVYPMMRGIPVVLVAVLSAAFSLGRSLNPGAWAGLAVVAAGIFFASFSRSTTRGGMGGSGGGASAGVIGFVLLGAAGVAGYTLLDSVAMRMLSETGRDSMAVALVYLFLVEVFLTAGLLAVAGLTHRGRSSLTTCLKAPRNAILTGVFFTIAYLLVLIAMPLADNVSYIQAFRQISLPLGMLAGVIWLKERPSPARLAGLGTMLAGLVIMAMA